MWILSYVVSNVGLLMVVTLIIMALGAVAWFSKNWKVAVVAVAVLAAGFAYMQIDKNAYQRRVAEEAAEQVKVLESRLNTVNAINKAYNTRYTADQNKLSALEKLASETPPNSSACLPADASRRVRSIR